MAKKRKNKTKQQPPTRRVGGDYSYQTPSEAPYYDPSEYSDYYKNTKRGRKPRKNTQYHPRAKRTVSRGNIPGPVVILLAVIAGIFLSFSILGAGFLIVSQPDLPTELLSKATNSSDKSPFNRDELAKSAVATKNFSFVDNSQDKLFLTLYDINASCKQDGRAKDGAPDMGTQIIEGDSNNKAKIQVIQDNINNSSISDQYLLKGNELNHLNDCYDLANLFKIFLTLFASIGIVLLIVCTYSRGARLLGRVLYWSALGTLLLFIVLGIFAAINFDAFFSGFHQIFFAQGNWQFDPNCLLICSLPTNFWIAIGVLLLLVEIIICAILMGIGSLLRRRF